MANSNQSLINCLQQLEKDFEKASVDLDIIISNPKFDDDDNTIALLKKKLHILCSCFSQLFHKVHITNEANGCLVKDVSNLKEELLTEKAKFDATSIETSQLVTQLHVLQLQLHSATIGDSNGDLEPVQKKLQNELDTFRDNVRSRFYLQEQVAMLKKENAVLNSSISQLREELYGARLAAKYMDKEISGRIQQIQLLGQNNKLLNVETMWRQLEAEILFHRQKTVIKAHKGINKFNDKLSNAKSRKPTVDKKVRQVVIHKKVTEGLGISIVGGREHGVPIIITEIHNGGVVHRNGGLMIGDAILAVNKVDIQNASHQEAIKALSQKVETLNLEVRFVNISEESDDDDGSVLEVEIAGANLSGEAPSSTSTSLTSGNLPSASVVSSPSESLSTCDSGLEAGAKGYSDESDSKPVHQKLDQ